MKVMAARGYDLIVFMGMNSKGSQVLNSGEPLPDFAGVSGYRVDSSPRKHHFSVPVWAVLSIYKASSKILIRNDFNNNKVLKDRVAGKKTFVNHHLKSG